MVKSLFKSTAWEALLTTYLFGKGQKPGRIPSRDIWRYLKVFRELFDAAATADLAMSETQILAYASRVKIARLKP